MEVFLQIFHGKLEQLGVFLVYSSHMTTSVNITYFLSTSGVKCHNVISVFSALKESNVKTSLIKFKERSEYKTNTINAFCD